MRNQRSLKNELITQHWKFLLFYPLWKTPLLIINFRFPTNFIMETNRCIIFQPTNHLLIYALQEGGNSPPYFSQIYHF